MEEDMEEFDKKEAVDDTSMAAHKLSEMEPESEFLSLPMSLASHLVLPVEWTEETGLLTSMVAHQIYQPCQENLEETIPLMQSLKCESMIATDQELNEDTFEDNLRENL